MEPEGWEILRRLAVILFSLKYLKDLEPVEAVEMWTSPETDP